MHLLPLFIACAAHLLYLAASEKGLITPSGKKLEAQPLNPWNYNNKNISSDQWKLFTTGVQSWNGYWIRYSADGNIISNTFVKRTFNHLYPNLVVQTNSYTNLKFSSVGAGKSKVRFLYIHKLPLIENFYSLKGDDDDDDWTETTEQANNILSGSYLMFYPPYFAAWGYKKLNTNSIFFFEKFVKPSILPFNFRLSVTPFYVGGRFYRVSVAREVSSPQVYGKNSLWSDNQKGFTMINDNFVNSSVVWVGSTYCSTTDFHYTVKKVESILPGDFLPIGNDRVNLQLPDRVAVSFPKFVPVNNNNFIEFNFRWIVHDDEVISSVTTYDSEGHIFKDCTTIMNRKIIFHTES